MKKLISESKKSKNLGIEEMIVCVFPGLLQISPIIFYFINVTQGSKLYLFCPVFLNTVSV